MLRFRSITSRIIFLHLAAVVITAVAMPLVLFLFMSAAVNTVHNQAVREQAEWLSRYLRYGGDAKFTLDLPEGLRDLFSPEYRRYLYVVLDGSGRVLFSSRENLRNIFPVRDPSADVEYQQVTRDGEKIAGTSIRKEIDGALFWIQLGENLGHRDVLLDDVVSDFLRSVGWITIPILLLLLATDIVIVRRAMRPLLRASTQARDIGPARIDARLPVDDIPTEILPLVIAVNMAFDRLEQGFRRQREFASDAAHELRTPLAVLRARIETLPDKTVAEFLRHDIEGMSRVVGQLLDSADLETLVIDRGDRADLHQVCADVAEFVAPLAVAQRKAIAMSGPEGPVWVRGDGEMLRRAIRNLLENAIRHTLPETTVEVVVDENGTATILDEGEGIAASNRERIFDRFWHRDRQVGGGAGLGLSIVKRIVDAHGGEITVRNRAGHGAEFSVRLVKLPA